jgi:hypothetical protein
MAFAIQWTGPLGPATTQRRDSAAEALKSAMELLGNGYTEVVIAHKDGKLYAPVDFAEFYRDTIK